MVYYTVRVNKGKYKKQWQKSTKDKEIGSNKTREDSNTVKEKEAELR